MVREMTDEHWNYLDEKYGKLIHYMVKRTPKSSYMSYDEKVTDMHTIVLKVIQAYTPEEGKSDEVSDFIQTVHFGKYLKTSLWYERSKITKKSYRRGAIDSSLISLSSLEGDFMPGDMIEQQKREGPHWAFELKGDIKEFAQEIMSDMSNFKRNGDVNIAKVSRNLNIPTSRTKKYIQQLKHELKHYNEDS